MPGAAKKDIVERMDAFATKLLDEVAISYTTDKAGFALKDRISVFEQVAAWIKVKQSLAGEGDKATKGSMLREFSDQIKRDDDKRAASPGRRLPAKPAADAAGRNKPARKLIDQALDAAAAAKQRTKPAGTPPAGGHEPAGLAALKSSLPADHAGHIVGYRNGAVGEGAAADERDRRLRVGLLSDSDGDPDDADGSGDL